MQYNDFTKSQLNFYETYLKVNNKDRNSMMRK